MSTENTSSGGLTREEAAYHEAGHAVIAGWLGLDVSRVTIRPEGTSGGHCAIPQLAADPGKGVLVLLAGPAAHARFLKGVTLEDATWADDRRRALDLARQFAGEHAHGTVQAFVPTVQTLLERAWPTVGQVAQLLLTHETLGAFTWTFGGSS